MATRPITFRDTKVEKSAKLDNDGDSVVSFASGPIIHKPLIKYAWSANDKVNHDTFHRMLEEYREAKRRELDLELKAKQLAAQLARTEEAAKRALMQTDATAKGGAAQRLLDAERAISKLRDENAELRNKLAREKKKSTDTKSAHDDTKRRLEGALRDQRAMSKRVGEVERKNSMLMRKPEDEFWGEEAGRRFVIQQEELVALREENAELRKKQDMIDSAIAGDSSHLESQLQELTALVKFYEKKITHLADQQIILPQDDVPGGPSSSDWILEEHIVKDEMFLLDRKSGKLFTNPGEGSWPRPVGVRTGTEVKMGSQSKMERFISTLDHYLQTKGERLREIFNEFDLDNSGFLDRTELARLIQQLMPDAQQRDVDELRTMLDADGDGQITYDELVGTIQEAYAARNAAKMGKNIQVNDTLERIRDILKNNRKSVQEAFDEMDSDHDGCLYHMEVVRMVRRFLPDMYQKEVRFLLAKLQEWDVTGQGKCTYQEMYQAMELAQIYRVGQGMAGLARAASPNRGQPLSPTRLGKPTPMMSTSMALVRQSAGQGLKEGFLRERVMLLEAELKAAQDKESMLEAEAKQVTELRRDLSAYKVRIEELQKDMMRIDVVGKLGEAEGASGDDRLKQAWETASLFKKRFMEHKAELDAIKVSYARMQAQLDETHRLLNDEHRRRFQMEDELSHANMELQRVKDLEARLMQERVQRVKLERDYLELQNKAFNAPTQQLVEVRQLQTEVFALRREKVLAEQNENAVRLELSRVREQLDGMSLEHYKAWQRDHDALKRRIVELELELQAALDKLEVYRRTQPPGVSDVLLGGNRESMFKDNRPDSEKSAEELRIELGQLRDVWRMDQDELKKLHQVLEIEEGKCMEARAALEEAHREMDRLRRDYQDQIRGLQRELENRDERIRRLELQLRGAYLGVNNAIRSGLRDSQLTGDPDDMSDIGEMQNLLELHISDASAFEEVVGKEPSLFFTVDFFMHETQATQVVASNAPAFNTIIQFVVEQEPFLVEYLDTHVMELELNRARGWDYDPVGVARVPLRQLLDDVDIGSALGHNLAWHHADVFGADNRRIGRVRYGFRFRKPLDSLVKQYREFARSKRPSEPDPRDQAFVAVQTASQQPKTASYVKVVVVGCRNLVPQSRHAVRQCRPYVHYRFPGHRDPHTTKVLYGLAPDFHDEATWLIAHTPEIDANFRTREMQFLVFDDSGGDDPQRGIVGVAVVPLSDLSRGLPVEGAFRLINPITREVSGQIILGMGWHNPLKLPGEAPTLPANQLRDMMARGPREVPRQTADSDISFRGYANPQGPAAGNFGLESETRGAAGQRSVPRDEFGESLRPAYGQQQQQQRHGLEAEVRGRDAGGHGLEAEVGGVGRRPPTGLGGRGAGEQHGLAAEVGGGRGGGRGAGEQHGFAAEVGGGRGAGRGPGEQHGLAAEVGGQERSGGFGSRGGGVQHGLEAEVGGGRSGSFGSRGAGEQREGLGRGAGERHGLEADLQAESGRGIGSDSGRRREEDFGLLSDALDPPARSSGLPAGARGRQLAPSAGGAGRRGEQEFGLGGDLGLAAEGRWGSGGGGGGQGSSFGFAAEVDDQDDRGMGRPRGAGGPAAGRGPGSGTAGRGGGDFGLGPEIGGPVAGGRGGSGRGPGPLGEAVELIEDGDEEEESNWASPLLRLPSTMLLSGGGARQAVQQQDGAAGHTRQRYADAALSPATQQLVALPLPPQLQQQQQQQQPSSVLTRVPANPAHWPSPATHIVLHLDKLELTPLAQSEPSLNNLFLMHAFLEVPELEVTCTSPPLPNRPGASTLDYCVAYALDQQSLASRRAVTELLDKLTGGEGAFVDIRLFSSQGSSQAPGLPMQRPAGAARAVASCELALSGMWSGRQGDIVGRRLALVGDAGMGAAEGLVLGHVVVTLRAAEALKALRRAQG